MKNLLSTVDNYIVQREKDELNNRIMDCHRPSSYSKCRRELYYMWTGHEISNYPDATDVYRMKVGTWIHEGFQQILTEMFGENVIHEYEFIKYVDGLKFPIIGHMDSVIITDDGLIGAELKTTFGRGIADIARNNKPMEQHEEQVMCYFVSDENIITFFLPYLGRDSFYRTEFKYQLTVEEKEKFFEKMIAKFKEIEHAVETKTIPDRDYQAIVFDGEIRKEKQHKNIKYKSNWQCLYCNYRDACYADEIADFGLHLPIINKED